MSSDKRVYTDKYGKPLPRERKRDLVKAGQSTNRSKYCPHVEAAKHERRNNGN